MPAGIIQSSTIRYDPFGPFKVPIFRARKSGDRGPQKGSFVLKRSDFKDFLHVYIPERAWIVQNGMQECSDGVGACRKMQIW